MNVARQALHSRLITVMELRNKMMLSRTAVPLRRIENAEVARLSAELSPLPEARVATIIATYRRPELLLRAVDSALAQTISDHMVLVIDDGAGLPALPTDPRLRACSLSVNTAVAGVVRNVGIRLTRSTYVAFLDDDNEWEPDHLEVSLRALETGAPDQWPGLVYTGLKRVFPDGRLLDEISTPFDRRLLAGKAYVDTSALVIRRMPGLHFSRLARQREVHPKEDWELVYRLSRRVTVVHVPVATVRYQISPDSSWSNWDGLLATNKQSSDGVGDST
jgi:hypothetical protein